MSQAHALVGAEPRLELGRSAHPAPACKGSGELRPSHPNSSTGTQVLAAICSALSPSCATHPSSQAGQALWPLKHQGKQAQPQAPLVPKLCSAEGRDRHRDDKLPLQPLA